MSLTTTLILACLAPVVCWLVLALSVAARRAYRRRGSADQRRERLARMLGECDLVVVPTGDVALSEADVREVAAASGFRLLGYEHTGGPFRRRCGVLVRDRGGVAAVLDGRDPGEPD